MRPRGRDGRHGRTAPARTLKANLQPQYTTVGHVTIDVLSDGSRQAGGAAFYSALQAARLGLAARIVTRGVVSEIEQLLEPFQQELTLEIQPAQHTTTLHTAGSGQARTQRVLAWAQPIADDIEIHSTLLHLAPVARESPARWRGHSAFVGLTPQGLARRWSGSDAPIALAPPSSADEAVADRCNALVVSAHERSCCGALIARARAAGATVAITDGSNPNTLLLADGSSRSLAVPPLYGGGAGVEHSADAGADADLGAGDVFAAAFFVALWEGRAADDAVSFANAAAAVRMSGAGAGAIGDRVSIDARLSAVAAERR